MKFYIPSLKIARYLTDYDANQERKAHLKYYSRFSRISVLAIPSTFILEAFPTTISEVKDLFKSKKQFIKLDQVDTTTNIQIPLISDYNQQ